MAAEERVAFYMDEHVLLAVSHALRRRGVDVMTAQEAGMLEVLDTEHLVLAMRHGRTIFTQDADFLRLHAAGHPHRGIVYASQQTALGTIVRGLMLIYEILSPDDMVGHVEFL